MKGVVTHDGLDSIISSMESIDKIASEVSNERNTNLHCSVRFIGCNHALVLKVASSGFGHCGLHRSWSDNPKYPLPSGQRAAPPQPESEVEMTSGETGRRLIEDWLPINEISIEVMREGGVLAGHPPVSQLHVWWSRKPLIAARATVAASILPSNTDRAEFITNIGTSSDVVIARKRMDEIKATGQWSNVELPIQWSGLHNPKSLTTTLRYGPPKSRSFRWRRLNTLRSRASGVQDHRQRTQPSSGNHLPLHLSSGPRNTDGSCSHTSRMSGADS